MERRHDSVHAQPPAAAPHRQGAPQAQTALHRMVLESGRATAQRRLAGMVQSSARVQAQGRLCQLVAQSPRMQAKRAPAPAPRSGGAPLPAGLRSGIFQLSGIDLSGASVHRNSPAPGRIQAHAYAQAGQIHLGPGQERHLPHEAWHLVQQAQGRVRATLQAKGIAINDDKALEHEADRMGARAERLGRGSGGAAAPAASPIQRAAAPVAQAFWLRRDGSPPEWINNARKVDALLAPEPAPSAAEAQGQDGGAAFENSYHGSVIYRLAGQVQVPWDALSRLITLLGAARMQAVYVRQFSLWGTEAGVAALAAQLDNLARMDLNVLQALFAQPAHDVAHLLRTASGSDLRRLFSGKRERQLEFIESGAWRTVQLPLPPEEAGADDAQAEGGAENGRKPDDAHGPARTPAPATPAAQRAAIRAAVVERIADRRGAAPRESPGQWLDGLARQWSGAHIADNIGMADAARGRSVAPLAAIDLPGAPGGIFHGAQERVRTAVADGPYETADAVVQRRPGRARIGGDYTDPEGRKHVGAVRGSFSGYLSGMSGRHDIGSVMASGTGAASAWLAARTEPDGGMSGRLSGTIGLPDAFITLDAEHARFEGSGALHSRMDATLEPTLAHWRAGEGGAQADAGRQILNDGAGNRAVLREQPLTLPGTQAGQQISGQLHGTSQGWNHPVRNAGRYSGLGVELLAACAEPAGVFQTGSLQAIVHHAGAAGTRRRYARSSEAATGPATLDGVLLAPTLALAGGIDQLVAAEQLTSAAAAVARMGFAASTPALKPASAAPDIGLASVLKAGSSYSVTADRKKYEFRLEALALPAHWSEGRFLYRFRLDYRPDARYLPQS